MKTSVLIIDDNPALKEDALIWELEARFGADSVVFIEDPIKALEFVSNNLDQNIIVLLDIQFPEDQMDGHRLLSEIRSLSHLIPVILWSGINEAKETFSDFINNQAFGFLSKTASSAEVMRMIDKAQEYFRTNLDNTIEDWIIQKEEDKDKPVYFTADGNSFSLNQILTEIRCQSDVGKSFAKKLNELTIDLLLRNKKSLND